LEALSNSDLVIVDGSFYGFLYPAVRMKKEGLYGQQEEAIVKETFQNTETLLRSANALGITKRSHTRAIGGYLVLHDRDSLFASIIDKLVLSLLMPANSVFNYRKPIGNNPVQIYTYLARHAQSAIWPEDPLTEAEKWVYAPYEPLNLDPSEFRGLRRIQVRAYEDVPPCEVEYLSRTPTSKLLEWIGQPDFFNKATNLPMALDLIDNNVRLSSKFTDEFVSEVEGRVLEIIDKNGGNQETVRVFFTLLNPQKLN